VLASIAVISVYQSTSCCFILQMSFTYHQSSACQLQPCRKQEQDVVCRCSFRRLRRAHQHSEQTHPCQPHCLLVQQVPCRLTLVSYMTREVYLHNCSHPASSSSVACDQYHCICTTCCVVYVSCKLYRFGSIAGQQAVHHVEKLSSVSAENGSQCQPWFMLGCTQWPNTSTSATCRLWPRRQD
jgi:hypothetical protein